MALISSPSEVLRPAASSSPSAVASPASPSEVLRPAASSPSAAASPAFPSEVLRPAARPQPADVVLVALVDHPAAVAVLAASSLSRSHAHTRTLSLSLSLSRARATILPAPPPTRGAMRRGAMRRGFPPSSSVVRGLTPRWKTSPVVSRLRGSIQPRVGAFRSDRFQCVRLIFNFGFVG